MGFVGPGHPARGQYIRYSIFVRDDAFPDKSGPTGSA